MSQQPAGRRSELHRVGCGCARGEGRGVRKRRRLAGSRQPPIGAPAAGVLRDRSVLLLQPDLRLPVSSRRESVDGADSRRRADADIDDEMKGSVTTPLPGLQAVIFDFDGVIADSEPLHFRSFREVLAEERIELTEEAYYTRFLGLSDAAAFVAIAGDRGTRWDRARLAALMARKAARFEQLERAGSVV